MAELMAETELMAEMRLCLSVGSSMTHLETGFMNDCPSRWQVKSVFPLPYYLYSKLPDFSYTVN